MLKVEKYVAASPEQMMLVIEGMRNPMNSWYRMDSHITSVEDSETAVSAPFEFFMGENDIGLAKRLSNGGSVHAKYRRMIPVLVTVTAPLYWWKEFDQYKVGTTTNSCSTMHKIMAKEFCIEDFSTDCLTDIKPMGVEAADHEIFLTGMQNTIGCLNLARDRYLEYKGKTLVECPDRDAIMERYWRQLIEMLPSSYNQTRTISLNYEVLYDIVKWRKNHKLTEWHTFCDWARTLPYSFLFTMEEDSEQA